MNNAKLEGGSAVCDLCHGQRTTVGDAKRVFDRGENEVALGLVCREGEEARRFGILFFD